jgi:hypothetical protein
VNGNGNFPFHLSNLYGVGGIILLIFVLAVAAQLGIAANFKGAIQL